VVQWPSGRGSEASGNVTQTPKGVIEEVPFGGDEAHKHRAR